MRRIYYTYNDNGMDVSKDCSPPLLSFDIETYAPEGISQSFENPIICISTALCEDPISGKFISKTWMANTLDDENKILEYFEKFLKKYPTATLVTYNGEGFDLPYLLKRGHLNLEKRDHIDVLKIARETIPREETKNFKLQTLEQHLGVKRLQRKVDGSNIHRLYDKPDFKKIRRHNREDAENTLQILFRLVKFSKDPPPLYSHQEKDKNDLLRLREEGKNALVQRPTQTGKTRTILEKIKRTSGRSLVVVPSKLLLKQWMHDAKKWGMKGHFIPITGLPFKGEGLGACQGKRKEYYERGRKKGLNIIGTPPALSNDFCRGYWDLSEFNDLHLDEAHHAIARKTNGKEGWRINRFYNFLKEIQEEREKKHITGTTIDVPDKKIRALKGELRMVSVTDDCVKTQDVEVSPIKIRDEIIKKAVQILQGVRTRTKRQAEKLLGEKVTLLQLLALNVDEYCKENDINEEKKKKLSQSINPLKYCTILEEDIYQEDIDTLVDHLLRNLSRGEKGWLYKQFNELFQLNFAKKKTEIIVRKTKKFVENGEKVLIYAERLNKVHELEDKLKKIGVKNIGLLKGKTKNEVTLRKAQEGEYNVMIMTNVAKEGLTFRHFDHLLCLSPPPTPFSRKNLYGRICGGEVLPLYYEGTPEAVGKNVRVKQAFAVLEQDRDIEFIKWKIRRVEKERYIVKSNPQDRGSYKTIKIPWGLSENDNQFIGRLGEEVTKYHLNNNGRNVTRVTDFHKNSLSKLPPPQRKFIDKIGGGTRKTVDLIDPDSLSLFEVKTSCNSNYPLRWDQAELLNEAKDYGFKPFKVEVKLNIKNQKKKQNSRYFDIKLYFFRV